jgi:UPF0755 protein
VRRGTIIFCLLILATGTGAASLREWWLQPFEGQKRVILQIDAGSSLATVAADLEQAQALRYPELWRQIARFKGQATQIKRGEYLITPNLSPSLILERLVAGDVVQYAVTLPEGIRLAQAIEMLHLQQQLAQTVSAVDDPRLLELVRPQTSAEGMFFPDTYQFSLGDTDLSILRRAHSRMKRLVSAEWQQRDPASLLSSPYQAVILASIVEKETGVASEREIIAGVFSRRLQNGMRLQTDPTVIYGLGDSFDGNLKRSHLEDQENPYNSYRHGGLPPTPIALVGRAALHAALHPAAGEALYFVARGDGSHAFSATIEEHNKAVRRYQLNRSGNYQSTPVGTQN